MRLLRTRRVRRWLGFRSGGGFVALFVTAMLVWTLAALFDSASPAPPPGTDLTSPVSRWFAKQRSVNGLVCCDVSDGHILSDDDWESRGGVYRVRINDQWLNVPDYALRDSVTGGPNPTGHAVVWFVGSESNGGAYITCFAPGTEY
jgi:hypothetical protein